MTELGVAASALGIASLVIQVVDSVSKVQTQVILRGYSIYEKFLKKYDIFLQKSSF